MNEIFISGNSGPNAKGDCCVSLALKESGGITLTIKSKVEALFGKSLRNLCLEMMEYYGIPDADITLEDTGALPFILRSRIETTVFKAFPDCKPYLNMDQAAHFSPTKKDRLRRSRLYLPGNNPKLMINAGLYQADGIILDLEDSVAPSKKDEARILVRNALRELNFYTSERMVRINPFPLGMKDLEAVIPQKVNCILIPKCESRDDVVRVDMMIGELMTSAGLDHPVWLMPIIESAKGVLAAQEIANASKNIVAITIGLEDLTADLGTERTAAGEETYLSRSLIVLAARSAGIQAIDSVFSDVSDLDTLKNTALESRSLGFDGMGCIHPRQIPVIHEAYAPTEHEIKKAAAIVKAYEDAAKNGLGVVSLGSKMIDAPVLKRALRTMETALESGLIDKNRSDENV